MIIAISHSPFSNTLSLEAIELALGLSSMGVPISLLFMNDGVYHLNADENDNNLAIKNFLKNLNCLELYDITQVYVCKQSLLKRKIQVKDSFKHSVIDEPLELLRSEQSLIL